MSQLTAQEVFDTVVNGLRAQGRKSVDADGTCMYRNDNGTKCAAGLLMLDEEYSDRMEGTSIDAILAGTEGLGCPSLHERLSPHSKLIVELQKIHDGHFAQHWEDAFRGLAMQFSLKYTEPS
jgi:hypothetical protein